MSPTTRQAPPDADDAARARAARAAYQRDWRARHGAVTGRVGRPASNPCGTPAAFRRHQRNGETPDAHCRDSWNAYMRYRREVRQSDGSVEALAGIEARYVEALAEIEARHAPKPRRRRKPTSTSSPVVSFRRGADLRPPGR